MGDSLPIRAGRLTGSGLAEACGGGERWLRGRPGRSGPVRRTWPRGLGERGGEDARARPANVLRGGPGRAGQPDPPALRRGVQARDAGGDRPEPRGPAGPRGPQVVRGRSARIRRHGSGRPAGARFRGRRRTRMRRVEHGAADTRQIPQSGASRLSRPASEPASRRSVQTGFGTGGPARCLPHRDFVIAIGPSGRRIGQALVAAGRRPCLLPDAGDSRNTEPAGPEEADPTPAGSATAEHAPQCAVMHRAWAGGSPTGHFGCMIPACLQPPRHGATCTPIPRPDP